MACCVIAAFLFAQIMAMLRRWAVFIGIARAHEGEADDTLYARLANVLRRPAVRVAVSAMLVVELGGGGTWLYVRHGNHIAEEADVAWSRMRGEHVIYAGICTTNSEDKRIRLVLDGPRHRGGVG